MSLLALLVASLWGAQVTAVKIGGAELPPMGDRISAVLSSTYEHPTTESMISFPAYAAIGVPAAPIGQILQY